jgi:hypothetical protein
MSIDLGLVPLTPQTGHCARAASQALLKELLGKGLARRGVSGRQVKPWDCPASEPCQRPLGAAKFGNLFRHFTSSLSDLNEAEV